MAKGRIECMNSSAVSILIFTTGQLTRAIYRYVQLKTLTHTLSIFVVLTYHKGQHMQRYSTISEG